MRIIAPVLLVLSLLGLPAASAQEPPEATVLLANVGNVNPSCGARHVWKLCHVTTEQRLAEAIGDIAPDLAVLIEVMPDAVCDGAPDASPFGVCAADHDRPQIERLLGDGYAVSCGRFAWDCLAVRGSAGTIDAPLVSLPNPENCDQGFVVGYADVTLHGRAFRVLLGHPDSGNDACRTAELEALLAQTTDRALLIGDMNLDPSYTGGASAALWNDNVGEGKTYGYHSDPSVLTHAPSDPTALDPTGTLTIDNYNCVVPFPCRALDHVASTFGEGSCDVLGETPGTTRLDGGGGADHRALRCTLAL